MAYTSSDLANIEAAILALATGSRVVSLQINNKTIQYGQANLTDLQALRSTIQASLGTVPLRTYAKQVRL